MKVLVMGGCADMAVPLNILLQKDEDVTEVTLADINYDKLKAKADILGPKFTAVKADANDHDQITGLMSGHDVVVCYIGPFYYFEKKLASCAIEAKVNYVSIADDYDAYLDVWTLDAKAKDTGVKILTGFGNSPGITQILARKGYNTLNNTARINVSWCAGSNEAAGVSNLTHLLHIFNATTLQWLNGREQRVKTGSAKKIVDFPEPIGKCAVYYTGHAESVSIPRNLPDLIEVTLHGGVKPQYIVTLVKMLSRLHLTNTHEKRMKSAKFFHKIEGWFAAKGLDKSVGRVDIYGSREGKRQYKYFTYVGHIADITSIPAYLAVKWLCQGKFDYKPGGVYAAERLLEEPEPFIEAMKELGVEIYESDITETPIV